MLSEKATVLNVQSKFEDTPSVPVVSGAAAGKIGDLAGAGGITPMEMTAAASGEGRTGLSGRRTHAFTPQVKQTTIYSVNVLFGLLDD